MKRSKEVQLITPQEYLKQATARVKSAKKRVFLVSLIIFHNELTKDLLKAIEKAAKRGVEVHIAADFMTFTHAMMNTKRVPLTYRSSSIYKTSELKRRFSAAGAKFYWLGQYYGSTFTNRTHSKWLIVDDTVFSFGGVNLDSVQNISNTDYMLKIKNEKIAEIILKEHLNIERTERTQQSSRNHEVKTEIGTILFDSGRFGSSVIYNKVCKLANQASEILLVSQYCPTGKLSKIISKKSSQLYFNQLKNVDSKLNRFMLKLGKHATYDNNLYQHKKYLHAKFIIFTMPDGSRQAITGSHNFVAASSRLGTREIALLTQNEEIISQIEDFFRENIA